MTARHRSYLADMLVEIACCAVVIATVLVLMGS